MAATDWLSSLRRRRRLRDAVHDPQAFESFYERHATGVYRYLARRVLDPEVALDLTAESFATALANLPRLRATTDEQELAWLYAIVRNELSAYWRKGAVERRAVARLGLDPVHMSLTELERMEELVALEDVSVVVRDALGRLPAEQRTAVHLRVVEGRGYSEIASSLEVTEQVARARVSRGLRRLGRMLADVAPEDCAA